MAKNHDPRYIPGVSEMDDDMTDAEWVEAYGEYVEDDTLLFLTDY
ncbi:hypothetical protein SEA_CASSITA_126 [Microbacterium phage Cassita]|nr:hypothetical protein SEA_CASSITA_1 [Microbacterium phage Cassita]USH44579.1 hypothetical protein SEA_CASSITA_126 [Microbacterium phage Cassita]